MQSSHRLTAGGTLVVGLLVAVLVVGAAPGVAAQADNGTATGNASFGAQVSAFMQSTAADANGSVDRGMWAGEAANASNPGAVVSDRARNLERRIDRLEERSQALSSSAGDGGPADVVYAARASAIRAELANLRQSVDQTVGTAESREVDAAGLSTLRDRANDVATPALPEEARRVTSSEAGPPEWVPAAGDDPGADQGNRPDGPGEGERPDERGNGGPSEDADDAPGNSGNAGSGDAGNDNGGNGGTNAGSGGGPSDQAGSGGNSGNSDAAGSGGQGNRP